MRIDVYLASSGILSSRSEAKSYIEEGLVYVGTKQILKPSFEIDGLEDQISVDTTVRIYASRGGIKLAGALKEFKLDVTGKRCIDVGASSGGFTDCLLQNGAQGVIAVDSGSGQLIDKIRQNDKVTVFENYNARYMKPSDFPYVPDFAVMDVSFISATYIIPALSDCLSDNADFVCLIKPQFEVGRAALGKGGIVKDSKARQAAVDKVVACARDCGFDTLGIITSPIKGGDGNVEFLAHFRKIRIS